MRLTVPGLKRAYTVRQWRDVFHENPYVAVLQLTGGRSWGRTNMRARVLGPELTSDAVNARYAVPWAARAAAEQTRYVGLANLFRAAPCAVIYGHDPGAVLAVLERARGMLDGGVVVGGRFGGEVVAARAWDEAAVLGGEDAVRAGLLRALASRGAPLVGVLGAGGERLVRALDAGGGAKRLVRAVGEVGKVGEGVGGEVEVEEGDAGAP